MSGSLTIETVPAHRFWAMVDKTDTCWLWTGYHDPKGYGRYSRLLAHRIAFYLTHGHLGDPVLTPQLDHLCRVRNCVNPAHLEPVSAAENCRRARKETCVRGHDLTVPENMRWATDGRRHGCMVCERARKPSRVPIREGDGDPRHGTVNGYKLTCRCADCTQANTDDCRARQQRKRVGEVAA